MAENEYNTVIVTGSQALARADGRVAILLRTRPLGPIAFEVSRATIALLRKELDRAEQLLSRRPGTV